MEQQQQLTEQQLQQLQQQGALFGGIFFIVFLVIALLMIISFWKIFTKAGEPGWAAIVPFYNLIVMMKISGKPAWWFILLFLPIVGLVISILACIGLAERFGKGSGYGVGLALLSPIFAPMLAFGDARYIGPKAA